MTRFTTTLAILCSLALVSGCTSGKSKKENADQAIAEGDAADDLAFDNTTADGTASADFADGTTAESLPEGTVSDSQGEQQIGSLKELDGDSTASALPPVPETLPEDKPISDLAPKPMLPLKKIETAPFEKNGKWLNAVYIAREGDTLKSVSQKIYGTEDRHKDLKSWNPNAKKKLKVGEKLYYNSPARPDDQQKLLVYYEDAGIAPMSYVSKDGDDLKNLSNEFIGHRDSWKEIFATNMSLQEKGKLTPGTEFKYWPKDAGVQPVAQNMNDMNGTAAGTVGGMDPNNDPNKVMPPPMPEPGKDSLGQPMPNDPLKQNMANNDLGAPPPPPQEALPPPAAMEPPLPPPPPPMEAAPKKGASKEAGFNPDELITYAGGALILIAVIVLLIIRRNRSRATRMDFTQQTQV